MTPRVDVSPAAGRDLDDLAGHLAGEAGLETALRFYDAAGATFERIARTTGIGERRESPDLRLDGLRVGRIEGFRNYLIFYRPAEDGIAIVRVLHGARDLDRILAEEVGNDAGGDG